MLKDQRIPVIQPSLPTGGGAIRGIAESFAPDGFTGAAALSIPVAVSPCRGFEPSLALTYSSGFGNGVFGSGFSLPIPLVARKTGTAVPRYTQEDVFVITGEDDLVPVGSAPAQGPDGSPYTVVGYRPRTEDSFARIEQWVSDADGSSFWRVTTANNVTSVFGSNPATRVADPADGSRVFQWLLEETFDARGNHVVYEYKPENLDNVPPALCERNRGAAAAKYVERIKYGKYSAAGDGVDAPPRWHFEVVFDYGEYDIGAATLTPYRPARAWAARSDPFSDYHAGFETRTRRLCRNVLMFHRFEDELGDEPVLVHATRFRYREDPTLTFMTGVDTAGYRLREDKTREVLPMPPVEFDYTPFRPSGHEFRPLAVGDGAPLPGLGGAGGFSLVDLFGEGLPGMLYSDGSATLYLEPGAQPTGDSPRYSAPSPLTSLPVERNLNGRDQVLMDVRGSGRLALVVARPGHAGFYEWGGEAGWTEFRPFRTFPTDFLDPRQHFVDVTGDSLADLVLLDGDQVRVYPALGADGYGPALAAGRGRDLPVGDGAATVALRFADAFGSGQEHLLRVTDGSVECWPNLGYGRFGARVALDNAPRYEGGLDASRLFLADVDGSGTADIVYVYPDRAEVFFNRSGNSFSDPLVVPLPGLLDRLDQIQFADLYGNGTTCLVFEETHPEPRRWCYDFSQGIKPHLLGGLTTNVGGRTEIDYCNSTKFYLEDKREGRPWATSLPFPVQVVERVTQLDFVSGTKLVSRYKYHHGFFDAAEREFRGFGMVEHLDAESPAGQTQGDESGPGSSPPLLTKTWHHTGSWEQDTEVSRAYRREYWGGDPDARPPLDLPFDYSAGQPDDETVRQAHRALKGLVLREEVYGLDGSADERTPYTVADTSYSVRLLRPPAAGGRGVYFAHPSETLTYDYERNAADPCVHHEVVVDMDEFGNVRRSCSIAYGRRAASGSTEAQQLSTKAIAQDDAFINSQSAGVNLLGVPREQKVYELTGLPAPSAPPYYTAAEISDYFEKSFDPATARLLSWQRHRYCDADGVSLCPPGQVTPQALVGRVEGVEFSDGEVTAAFDGALAAADLQKLLSGDAGYLKDGGYWWNPGPTASYFGPELFYSISATTDPFGNATRYEYDAHGLLLVKASAALGNETSADSLDYQAVQPARVRDINGNSSEVLFDPLGMVAAATRYGTEGGAPAGFAPLEGFNPPAPASTADMVNSPVTYLGGAAAYFHYDFFSWMGRVGAGDFAATGLDTAALMKELEARGYVTGEGAILQAFRDAPDAGSLELAPAFDSKRDDIFAALRGARSGVPVHAVTLLAGGYPNDAPAQPVHIRVAYNDGFGRDIYNVSNVEPGRAFTVAGDGTVTEADAATRWLASGRTLYNNKGNPVRQYEPYFIDTFDYVDNATLASFGVSPLLSYDALQRLVRADTPKGFFTKVEFTAWGQTHYDEDDTVLDSTFYKENSKNDAPDFAAELSALRKAALFHGTPSRQVFDNLGGLIREERTNEALVAEDAFVAAGLTSAQSQAVFAELTNGGFLDFRGALTPAFQPAAPGFSLNLSSSFAASEAQIVAALVSLQKKGTPLAAAHELDVRGRLLSTADARLSPAGKKNLTLTRAPGGDALKAVSADAGATWQLNDATGSPVYTRDSRGFELHTTYDALGRAAAVRVRGGDGTTPLDHFVERFVYGDSLDSQGRPVVEHPEALNLRGRLLTHCDHAGVTYHDSYGLLGGVLKSRRQLRLDYKAEANWGDPTPAALAPLLQTDVYQTVFEYDALGRVTSRTDPAGFVHRAAYQLSGWLNSVEVTPAGGGQAEVYVAGIVYDAKGQRVGVTYGNGVKTAYAYEKTTLRLSNVLTTRGSDSKRLQDLTYTYDPAGNVTRVADGASDAVFSGQQRVAPVSDYTYDALYQLIQGTGRQHAGATRDSERRGGFDPDSFFTLTGGPNDGQSLENYTRRYSYDAGGNLTRTRHLAPGGSGSFTRELVVSDSSNRGVEAELLNPGAAGETAPAALVDPFFDGNGNQKRMIGVAGLNWNYRDNLASVTTVDRGDAPPDAEYYVYDGSGQRVRRVLEQHGDGGARVEETIYLGGLEVRRVSLGDSVVEERQTLRVRDDARCVAVRQSWTKGGPPAGVSGPQVRYQLDDEIGSSLTEVDGRGQLISHEEYYPYGGTALAAGRDFAETSLKRYRHAGKERDAVTGFYYYGGRYYAPWLGRWASADPAGFIDGPNMYAFVGGNPVTFADLGGYGKVKKTKKHVIPPGAHPYARPGARTSPRDLSSTNLRIREASASGDPRSGNPRGIASEVTDYRWSAADPIAAAKNFKLDVSKNIAYKPVPDASIKDNAQTFVLSRIPRSDIHYYRLQSEVNDDFRGRVLAVQAKERVKSLGWMDISAQTPGRSKQQGPIMKKAMGEASATKYFRKAILGSQLEAHWSHLYGHGDISDHIAQQANNLMAASKYQNAQQGAIETGYRGHATYHGLSLQMKTRSYGMKKYVHATLWQVVSIKEAGTGKSFFRYHMKGSLLSFDKNEFDLMANAVAEIVKSKGTWKYGRDVKEY